MVISRKKYDITIKLHKHIITVITHTKCTFQLQAKHKELEVTERGFKTARVSYVSV